MQKVVSHRSWHRLVFIIVIAGLAVLFTQRVLGDPEQDARDMSRPLITQNGQLFVVRLAPTARRIDVLTAGKTVVVLDPSQITVFGRVFPRGGEPRDLKVAWLNGHFQISDPIDESTRFELEVSDKSKAKTETFRFDENSLKPAPAKEPKTQKSTIPLSPK